MSSGAVSKAAAGKGVVCAIVRNQHLSSFPPYSHAATPKQHTAAKHGTAHFTKP